MDLLALDDKDEVTAAARNFDDEAYTQFLKNNMAVIGNCRRGASKEELDALIDSFTYKTPERTKDFRKSIITSLTTERSSPIYLRRISPSFWIGSRVKPATLTQTFLRLRSIGKRRYSGNMYWNRYGPCYEGQRCRSF